METKRNKFSKEYKLEAVRRSLEPGVKVSHLARELGIRTSLLFRWRRAVRNNPDNPFPGSGHRATPPPLKTSSETSDASAKPSHDDELRRLRRENERLRQERDILKKATAFFASQSI